jgi:hypothetical protein
MLGDVQICEQNITRLPGKTFANALGYPALDYKEAQKLIYDSELLALAEKIALRR